MSQDTLQRIRTAALELFAANYYDFVSVAQICRTAGVSNGVFYRYYPNKETLFQGLLDDFFESFSRDLAAITSPDRHERLVQFISVVSGAVRRYAGEVTMFRMGQYRKPEYEEQLRLLYLDSARHVLGRDVTEAEYLFLLSGLRFISTRSLYHDLPIHRDMLLDIVENGLFNQQRTVPLEDPEGILSAHEECTRRNTGSADGEDGVDGEGGVEGVSGSDQFIEAGIRLFGEHGYFSVQVSDICRETSFSVGTFYKRFKSKEAFLAMIVHEIGHRTRRFLSCAIPVEGNALDREVCGMWNFLAYFGKHREYYSIVREGEFVVPLAVKEYYDAFEAGYKHTLGEFSKEKRRDIANFLMGLSHYSGIEILFSDRVPDPRTLVEQIGLLLAQGLQDT